MEDSLPNEFDLIVIGTGFTESVIAAAASRIGKNVLHIDTNNYYGREWASFNFNDLSTFLDDKLEKATYTETEVQQFYNQLKNGLATEKDDFLGLCNIGKINNIKQQWHILADKIDDEEMDENDKEIVSTKENPLIESSEKSEQMENKKDPVDCSVEGEQKQSIIEDTKTSDINSESITDEPKEKEVIQIMEKSIQKIKVSPKEMILKKSRDFNIDLYANLIYARGPLVELLISSNIARYGEFRSIDHILTIFNEQNRTIPCTRSDVFNSNDISIIEKRLLMKFLKSVQNLLNPVTDPNTTAINTASDDQSDSLNRNKTFLQYLREDAHFSEKLQHYFVYAICMADENTKYRCGIEKTKIFLKNLGRYGNTPFLLPMFACGEMGQHFCRSCAVFGGVYCLNRNISKISFDKLVPETTTTAVAASSVEEVTKGMEAVKTFRSIECNGQEIKAKHLVLSIPNNVGILQENTFEKPNNVNTKCDDDDDDVKVCGQISRGIFIIDKPIIDNTNTEKLDSDSNLIFLRIPKIHQQQQQQQHENQLNNKGAFVIQLSHRIKSCPKELWLVHITCEQNKNAEADLLPYVKRLFHIDNDDNSAIESSDNKPNILWSLYFNISSCFKCTNNNKSNEFIKNVHLTCGPYFELDYGKSIADAKAIFQNLYPNEEFLPRAPDPEEIIFFDDDTPVGANESALPAGSTSQTEDTIKNNNKNENSEEIDYNKENAINENLEI